jgi:pyruvate formate lyase activating enzyme
MVTAGYLNELPVRELYPSVDAANIDLKAMSESFYRDVCKATLKPVLRTMVVAKSLGTIVEVTNLLIPTLNDRDADLIALARWIAENLGSETPLHFSRFFPQYRMRHLPPTPAATLERAREIARAEGLAHVYIGNILVRDAANTYCASCKHLLVQRTGYRVLANRVRNNRCPDCKTEVYGRWQ